MSATGNFARFLMVTLLLGPIRRSPLWFTISQVRPLAAGLRIFSIRRPSLSQVSRRDIGAVGFLPELHDFSFSGCDHFYAEQRTVRSDRIHRFERQR
jgi:hypothetical protein